MPRNAARRRVGGLPPSAVTPARALLRSVAPSDACDASSAKTRILMVITRLTVGGDTNVVLDLAEHFGGHPDFEVHLAAGPVPDSELDLTARAHARGVRTSIVPHLVNRMSPLNLLALLELRALIRRGGYDIVHTHSSVAGVLGRVAAVTTGVPVIVHHVHGWGLRPDMRPVMRRVYVMLERICAWWTSSLVAVSQPTIDKGVAHGICRPEKFTLLYNGIDVGRFRRPIDAARVRQELGLAADTKVVGMIGRLDEQKNPLDFIRAAAVVLEHDPRVQFVLAGDGALRSDCERLVRELNLVGKVILLGFRDDVDQILPVLDIVALSSLWEGLPVVFQEAMSAGKAIVANDVDGASDVVIDGVTGYLVRPGRPDDMAARLLELLVNHSRRLQMGAAARERSAAFSEDRMRAGLEALYVKLLAARGLRAGPPAVVQLEQGGVR
jgi:glycosyltransferase involved in cell wall biosynthesis